MINSDGGRALCLGPVRRVLVLLLSLASPAFFVPAHAQHCDVVTEQSLYDDLIWLDREAQYQYDFGRWNSSVFEEFYIEYRLLEETFKRLCGPLPPSIRPKQRHEDLEREVARIIADSVYSPPPTPAYPKGDPYGSGAILSTDCPDGSAMILGQCDGALHEENNR